jgi:tetratricopeptide (TPR) repeat protein
MYTESHKQNCLNLANLLVEQYPNESKVYAMRADILVLSGKNEMALVDYLKSTKLENTNYKIWEQIVIIEQELNMVDSLIKHSEAALELFPNQASFWFYNGLAHQMKKNYKKSVISFEEGRKLSMNNKNLLVQFYTLLGDTYNSLKDFKKSDENFEEALKIDENNFLVLNNYSYYLSLRRDKLEYAKKMSERVIKEFPDNANYLDTYAWVLYVMKDYIKAKEIFEKIVNNTDNGVIVEHYGDVLYQLGEKDLALEQWRKAKTLGETSDLIDKKISDKKLYE